MSAYEPISGPGDADSQGDWETLRRREHACARPKPAAGSRRLHRGTRAGDRDRHHDIPRGADGRHRPARRRRLRRLALVRLPRGHDPGAALPDPRHRGRCREGRGDGARGARRRRRQDLQQGRIRAPSGAVAGHGAQFRRAAGAAHRGAKAGCRASARTSTRCARAWPKRCAAPRSTTTGSGWSAWPRWRTRSWCWAWGSSGW